MMSLLSLQKIKETLNQISKLIGPDFRLGIAGSYAKNEATENSDLDIVIDGNSMKQEVAEYIKQQFPIDVDILWLDLLKAEDEELDSFCIENDFLINDYSLYKTILREVMWITNR